MRLWVDGFVEQIEPPPLPFHILAQQIMALALQEPGIGKQSWQQHIVGMPGFAAMDNNDRESIVRFMLSEGILFEDSGLLMMGDDGESKFGRRNFMDLMSVFTSPPMFTILHGRKEIGQVHQHSFTTTGQGPAILALAGQNWRVSHIDWNKRLAYVEPSKDKGKSRWIGGGQPMHFELCQAIGNILMDEDNFIKVSDRGMALWENLQEEFEWLEPGKTFLINHGDIEARWWDFAGGMLNSQMATYLDNNGLQTSQDNFSVTVKSSVAPEDLKLVIQDFLNNHHESVDDESKEKADGLKFSACIPGEIYKLMLDKRDSVEDVKNWVKKTTFTHISEA